MTSGWVGQVGSGLIRPEFLVNSCDLQCNQLLASPMQVLGQMHDLLAESRGAMLSSI